VAEPEYFQRGDQGVLTMRWLLLCLVFVVGVSISQDKDKKDGGNKGKEPPKVEQPITINLSAPSNISVSGELQLKGKIDQTAKHENWYESPEVWIAIFTALLVGVTARLAYVTWKLWRSTRRLVKDSKKTSKKELRAYVALEHIYFSTEKRQLPLGQTLEQMVKPLNIRIRNYGKTPSFETSIWCDGNTVKPISFDARSPGAGKQIISAANHYSIAVSQPETPGPYKRDGPGGWMWGHLVYRDVFDRWWRTNFFWRYHPPEDGKGEGLFSPETEYNEEKGPYKSETEALAGAGRATVLSTSR
jgi:hypothetical protein